MDVSWDFGFHLLGLDDHDVLLGQVLFFEVNQVLEISHEMDLGSKLVSQFVLTHFFERLTHYCNNHVHEQEQKEDSCKDEHQGSWICIVTRLIPVQRVEFT